MKSEAPFKIFNSLNGQKEEFNPCDSDHIKIYACGPTVYNYAHIGNARMAVVFDTFVRTLRIFIQKLHTYQILLISMTKLSRQLMSRK